LTSNPEEGYVVPSIDAVKNERYADPAAAADTTSNATIPPQNVVNNTVIYNRLVAELKVVFP
jgi:hypothetical protein